MADALIDRFNRQIRYVRLSVTDRCDLRCCYCMAERPMRFLPRAQLLTLEEIARVGRVLVALGVTKLRLTGGEPLMRRDLVWLCERLGALPGLAELALTTNGTQLPRHAQALAAAGVTSVNVSLDSLRPERFRAITRRGHLGQTLAGIEAAQAAGFARIKLNCVILPQRNHDEADELVAFAIERGLDIRFIEAMPLGASGDQDSTAATYPADRLRADLARRYALIPTLETSGGPARYWRVAGTATRVGFIAPHSHAFCADCNRVRVTAEGQLLPCLGQRQAIDLRRTLRAHPGEDAPLEHAIRQAIASKPRGHDFASTAHAIVHRPMSAIGG